MEKLTIDLQQAGNKSLYLLIFLLLVFGVPYYFLWSEQFTRIHFKNTLNNLTDRFGFLLALIPFFILTIGIVLHELTHGITWALYTKNGHKSIKYGFLKDTLTPYCHCTEPLKIKHYIIGAIMPAIVVGIIPLLYSIITGNFYLLLFGIFFTNAAIGDFMIISLLKYENMKSIVQDHPTEAGFYITRA